MNTSELNALPPTIDLHVHLRGTLAPSHALQLAQTNDIALPEGIIDARHGYRYDSFAGFLDVYNTVGRVVRTGADLAGLTEAYLTRARDEGAIYVELMLSPIHSIENGISFEEQIEAVANAAGRVPRIASCLVVTAVRHRGAEQAEVVARLAARRTNPIIRGFGLTGDEFKFESADFRAAFEIAHDAGLGLTAHAGEWGTASSVLDAVKQLRLTRIGHGITAVKDASILEQLAKLQVTFEICQTANRLLRAIGPEETHPIAQLVAAGCRVALGTDDPEYFHTSIGTEYRAAKQLLTSSQVAQLTTNAINAAFCDDNTKNNLLRITREHTHPKPDKVGGA